MASRFSWSKEDVDAQVQFDVAQAKESLDDVEEHVKSLISVGRIPKKEAKSIEKTISALRKSINSAANK